MLLSMILFDVKEKKKGKTYGIGQQDYLKPVNEQIYKHETVTTSSGKVAEDCEKWRLSNDCQGKPSL